MLHINYIMRVIDFNLLCAEVVALIISNLKQKLSKYLKAIFLRLWEFC